MPWNASPKRKTATIAKTRLHTILSLRAIWSRRAIGGRVPLSPCRLWSGRVILAPVAQQFLQSTGAWRKTVPHKFLRAPPGIAWAIERPLRTPRPGSLASPRSLKNPSSWRRTPRSVIVSRRALAERKLHSPLRAAQHARKEASDGKLTRRDQFGRQGANATWRKDRSASIRCEEC
jgi:hypothetical protein